MGASYPILKRLLPEPVREWLSGVNQRWFARRTLLRKYGDWFEVDWRKKFRSLTDEEWKDAYNRAWKHRTNDCAEESDIALFLEVLSERGSVLEVGCGMGSLALALARAGHRVTGVDVSEEALRLASERTEGHAVIDWKVGFAEQLPVPAKSFDYITCSHTLEHVKDLERTAREFKRVARKKIVILTPKQKFRLYQDSYHTQFFETKEMLVAAFGLSRYECREVDCSDHRREFRGTAWFYVGWLDDPKGTG